MHGPDAFSKRERALEDEFFHRVDEKLREQLRESIKRDEKRQAMVQATGFENSPLIDELIDAGLQSTTLVALSLVPSIFVAWADGSVTDAEMKAVIKAAHEHGIDQSGYGGQLLTKWLQERPPQSLWETWKHYARALQGTVAPDVLVTVHTSIRRQATAVAQASGGVLGVGKISTAESVYLDDLDAVFEHQD